VINILRLGSVEQKKQGYKNLYEERISKKNEGKSEKVVPLRGGK